MRHRDDNLLGGVVDGAIDAKRAKEGHVSRGGCNETRPKLGRSGELHQSRTHATAATYDEEPIAGPEP